MGALGAGEVPMESDAIASVAPASSEEGAEADMVSMTSEDLKKGDRRGRRMNLGDDDHRCF